MRKRTKKPEPAIFLQKLMSRSEFQRTAGVSDTTVSAWCELAGFPKFRRGQKLDMHQTVILSFMWYASMRLKESMADYKSQVIDKGLARKYHEVYRKKFGKACLKTRIQDELAEGILTEGKAEIAQIILDWIGALEEIETEEETTKNAQPDVPSGPD